MAWEIWTILEAVDWRWTINDILDQPEGLLSDIVQISGMASQYRRQNPPDKQDLFSMGGTDKIAGYI